MPIDEQQLSTLIDAAVREAVERTTRELSAKFEADTAGLRRNRDDLLSEKKSGEGKSWEETLANFDKEMTALSERLAKSSEATDRLLGKSPQPSQPASAHTITRGEARDSARYREAKAAAEKAGVDLLILDENAPAQQQGRRSSAVKYIADDDAGTLWINQALVDQHGQARMRQKAADAGKQFRAFRSVEDLPDGIAARHAEIIASGDRANLLGNQ